MNKPIYKETYTKIIDKSHILEFFIELYDTYRYSDGWIIEKPKTINLSNNKVKVLINIKKYNLNNNLPYKELFIKTIKKSDIKTFVNSIQETYTKENGWLVEEPIIFYEENDDVTLGFLITKEDTVLIKR